MNKAEKNQGIEELQASFGKAKGAFLADFRGLTVEQITALRFELKKSQTDLKVVKNRLALRALQSGPSTEGIRPFFDYMTAVAFTYGDVAQSAKSLTKFAADNEKLKLKAALVEGKVISLADIKALSKLPSRQELLGKLLGTLVAVPTNFVRVLNGVPTKWVYLLEAVRKQKEQKGG